MPIPNKSPLFDGEGRSVFLADKLAPDGGEGAIFALRNQSEFAAKIYHRSISAEKSAKLRLMISLRTEKLLKLAAWPVNTLHEQPKGRIVGFVMPKVKNHKVVHELYSIKSRLVEFPEARWSFLIHAAANIARAIGTVHQHDHVIGDINHGSLGISNSGTVTLFDCDSFQITVNGSQYLCDVGIDTHTPPELQSASFRGVIRSKNHDAFGLAVLIFQLLFLGRHPFAGKFLGATEQPPIGKLIANHRFAYGPDASRRRMQQPPGTLDLDALPIEMGQLFERAFSQTATRPMAHEWIDALARLASALRQCNTNPSHQFFARLASCPWCKIEALSGIVVFAYLTVPTQFGAFQLTTLWSLITAVPSPGPLPSLVERKVLRLVRSANASRIKRSQFLWSLLTSAILVAVSVVSIAAPIGTSASAWLVVVSGVICLAVSNRRYADAQRLLELEKQAAEQRWRVAEQRWNEQAGPARFVNKCRELEEQKKEYEGLANLRQHKLRDLQRNIRKRQLHKFLDRHLIRRAGISGIGPSRQATLSSYGIETAADIDWRTVSNVPGFGPVNTSKLVAWRSSIEQRFVFNPTIGIDPADKNAVEAEIATARNRLEQSLQAGPTQLRQISQQILSSRSTMRPIAEASLKEAAQADLDAGSTLSLALRTVPILLVFVGSLVAISPLKAYLTRPALTISAAPKNVPATPSPNLTPTPTMEQRKADAQRRYREGVELTRAHKYSEAIIAYQDALTLNPELADIHHELAFALLSTRKFKQSVAAAKRAIELKSDNAGTYRILGMAHLGLQEWKQAIVAFERSTEIEPDNPTGYYQLGLACVGNEDFESSIAAFKEAVRLRPDYPVARYALGKAYVAIGDTQAAMEQYDLLVTTNPKLAKKLLENIEAGSD